VDGEETLNGRTDHVVANSLDIAMDEEMTWS
jgi:hypothetical protein